MALRIVVVGGVAGGMSAAARARRLDESASITVLEKTGHISFANCGLPYFVGGKIVDEQELYLTTPERVQERFRIDARVRHEVTAIDPQTKTVHGTNLATGEPFSLPYDKVILAPGAAPILPAIPGLSAPNVFTLRNVEDALALKAFATSPGVRRAVVVGAGFIGLEMVEALVARGLSVTVLEKAPQALPPLAGEMAGWVEHELRANGVTLRLGTGIAGVTLREGSVSEVVTETGEAIATDLVLLAMGVRPSLALAELAGLTLGARGGIQVDAALRTSDPDIYAVGDAIEVVHGVTLSETRIPLAGAANRHGRTAGEHAVTGQAAPAATVFGTAVLRIFGLDVAMTGLGPVAARQAGFDVDFVIIHPNDHASYYPGATPMHLMLTYDTQSQRVLGAQAVGPKGIDKRIDVIATLLHFGGTLSDLANLDLTYAPQFSSAKDPVHMAAFVAQNQVSGLTPSVDTLPDGAQLVDVRTPSEFAAGSLPTAINLPLDSLREQLGQLDPQRPVVTMCRVGLRGHVATRILKQRGFAEVSNLRGGYLQHKLRHE